MERTNLPSFAKERVNIGSSSMVRAKNFDSNFFLENGLEVITWTKAGSKTLLHGLGRRANYIIVYQSRTAIISCTSRNEYSNTFYCNADNVSATIIAI